MSFWAGGKFQQRPELPLSLAMFSKMMAGVQCRRLDQAGLVQINGNMRMLPAGLLTLAREVRVILLSPRDGC